MMRAPFFPWALARKGSPAMDEHSHTEPPSEPTLRIKALESLLVEKGLVDAGAVDEIIELFEKRIGPRNGAKVVAHAWAYPAYKKRLLEDGSKAIAELGFTGLQGEDMVVLENTQRRRARSSGHARCHDRHRHPEGQSLSMAGEHP